MNKIIAVAALTLGTTSCLGPNHMFNGLTNWNANVSDQDWMDEIIYVGMHVIPIYWVTLVADHVILNTVDYWSGENPWKDPGPFPHEAFGK